MPRDVRYFAYGTLQTGFPNHAAFAADLGAGLGPYVTVESYPLVVPLRSGCANPGCRFVHRMCALLSEAGTGLPVEGELFAVDLATIDRLDRLESYRADDEAGSAYLRREVRVAPLDQAGEPVDAQVYFVSDAAAWRRLLDDGEAEVVARYTKALAVGPLKECCRRDPGHPGPHDVIDLVSS